MFRIMYLLTSDSMFGDFVPATSSSLMFVRSLRLVRQIRRFCIHLNLVIVHKYTPESIDCLWPKFLKHHEECKNPEYKYVEDFPLCNPKVFLPQVLKIFKFSRTGTRTIPFCLLSSLALTITTAVQNGTTAAAVQAKPTGLSENLTMARVAAQMAIVG